MTENTESSRVMIFPETDRGDFMAMTAVWVICVLGSRAAFEFHPFAAFGLLLAGGAYLAVLKGVRAERGENSE